MVSNKTRIINYLEKLMFKLDIKNKPFYYSVKLSIDLNLYKENLGLCKYVKNQFKNLKVDDTNVFLNYQIVNAIDEICDFFDSYISMLILLGFKDKEEPKKSTSSSNPMSFTQYLNSLKLEMRKKYIKNLSIEERFRNLNCNNKIPRHLQIKKSEYLKCKKVNYG